MIKYRRWEPPRGPLLIQGRLFLNARNLKCLRNIFRTIRRQWTPGQFKSSRSWQVSSGHLSCGHLFRESRITRQHLLSVRCIPGPVLSAFGPFTHWISISTLQRGYFHYLHYTEVESWAERSRHFLEFPWCGRVQWGLLQAFWPPHSEWPHIPPAS